MRKFWTVIKAGDWLEFLGPGPSPVRYPRRSPVRRIFTYATRVDAKKCATQLAKDDRTDYYVMELFGAVTGRTDWVEADP